MSILAERRAEYDVNVWDHTTDPFQLSFDVVEPLDADALVLLTTITEALGSGESDEAIGALMAQLIDGDEGRLFLFMRVAGLTRSKILTDLKAAKGVRVPSAPVGLLRRPEAWAVAGPYLAARIRNVLEPLSELDDPRPAFEGINQVSWGHWIRQERAKLQGHEAEHRVAVMLKALGIPFVPEEKADNPLCRDAQIDGISYDIVVPDTAVPVMVMKSTVQTSNIGQFGESKANLEVTEAKASLAGAYPSSPPKLVAMVDGVGFNSNIQGLNGVLEHADEFCQFKSIWKAAVVAADELGISLSLALPAKAIELHAGFLEQYGGHLEVHEATAELRASLPATALVDAGEAFMWRED